MANDFYTVTTDLTPRTRARSGVIDTEYAGIEDGFDKLPTHNQLKSDNVSYVAAGGTANAITVTHPYTAWTAFNDGWKIVIKIATTNTGAVTLAPDGLSAKAAVRNDGTALQSGDLQAGGVYEFIYNSTSGHFRVPEAINGVLEDCEDQVAIASALNNFKGLWGAQTGSASVPYSVYYNGAFYALREDIADVTAKTPGTDPGWLIVDSAPSWSGMTGAGAEGIVSFHLNKFWKLNQAVADVTAKTPGTAPEWSELTNSALNYQEFPSSETWTKPAGLYAKVFVEVIGGGGGGGKVENGSGSVGGGGGGEYAGAWFDIDDLGATETVTIGAGGAGLGDSSGPGAGSDGGATSFGAHLSARGGKGGHPTGSSDFRTYNAGGDGSTNTGGYGAGAGGTGSSTSGYPATMGGAGGAGSGGSSASGGVSQHGGDGGDSAAGVGAVAQNGTQPGGGGGGCRGGSSTAISGDGGAGICRVWSF